MTVRLLFLPRAQLDLEDIWDYSAAHWGTERAERYIRQLWQHAEEIAAQPRLGQSCDGTREGYRKYRAGSHVLFYRSGDGGIEIVRILHERMDYDQHL